MQSVDIVFYPLAKRLSNKLGKSAVSAGYHGHRGIYWGREVLVQGFERQYLIVETQVEDNRNLFNRDVHQGGIKKLVAAKHLGQG